MFDAHLHCPAESGELWQWHKVTRNFEEFAAYLDRTGVDRGIMNSQRSQGRGTAADMVAGNREVARFVEKSRGRFLGSCAVNPRFIDEALKEVEYCRKQLAAYKVPRQIEFRDELPKSAILKVLRRELRSQELAKLEAKAERSA